MKTARGAGRWRAGTAAMVMAAACGPKPAEPLPVEPRIVHAGSARAPISDPYLVRAPRPDVTFPDLVPDLAEEPRWPLTGMQHPSLQPSFDVAGALAEDGIGWTDLCARGVDRRRDPSRHDELVYLAGWCSAARRDPLGAVAELAQVRGSAVAGIAHAVTFDVADILVDSQDAEHADQILAHTGLRSTSLYDVLGAAYFEIGRTDDALRVTAAALQLDDRRDEAATCHRLARSALLSPKAGQALIAGELTSAAHRRIPDPTCVELAAAVSCVVDSGCHDYRTLHHLDDGTIELARIAEYWTQALSWQDWMSVVQQVRYTVVRPQTERMFDGALEAAVVATECDATKLRSIAKALDGMFAPARALPVTPKAAWARKLWQQPSACTEFRAHWLLEHPQ